MESQTPPVISPTSQPSQHYYYHQRSGETSPNEPDYALYEKDAYQRNQIARSDVATQRGHDSVISHPFSPKASTPPSPSSSISSARRHDSQAPEIQQSSPVNLKYPPRAHIDPEKQAVSPHSPRSPTRVSSSNPEVTDILYESGDYSEKGPEDKAVQLLLYLSGPCALLSFVITIWTFVSLFIAILLQPFRLCTTRPSFSSQLTTFLAPPLNSQLHLIYSYSSTIDYSPSLLVVIHLFSPVIALGVAVSAWTAAFFWFFSAILGDPAGQDGHNDGRDSILGVRNWWDRWLSRALR